MRTLSNVVISDQQRERLLRRAVEQSPFSMEARLNLAILLFGQRRNAEALPHFAFLLEQAPQTTIFRASLAVCYAHVGDYDRATELYEECRDAFGEDLNFLVNYAEALKYQGRKDDCVVILRHALRHHPGSGLAWWALANMKTVAFSAQDIETMRAIAAGRSLGGPDAYHIHYALGRAFEQRGEYAASFAHYARGAELKRAEISFDDRGSVDMAQRVKHFFSAERLAKTPGKDFDGSAPVSPTPIFIVGMPRAGSTLVEQILSSHSMVEGTMELPEIATIVHDLDSMRPDCRYPEILAQHDQAALAALGRHYIGNTRIYRKTAKPFFTDKMPSNCAHVGLIHMILPNARIIDVRRDKLPNGFSVFKQLFGNGLGYSYDFSEIARYYSLYVDNMAHFDNILPGRVHRVRYEDLVNDTETEVHRLLAYCGLELEPACLRFWDNGRAVATPSAEQVRRPIFREALDAWRHYEPWLGPLKQALCETAAP